MSIGSGVSDFWGSKNRVVPLTRPIALTTFLHYRAGCDIVWWKKFGDVLCQCFKTHTQTFFKVHFCITFLTHHHRTQSFRVYLQFSRKRRKAFASIRHINLHISPLLNTPSSPIDNIWAMMLVWRWEGRLSELFCVVLCTEAVHSYKHT